MKNRTQVGHMSAILLRMKICISKCLENPRIFIRSQNFKIAAEGLKKFFKKSLKKFPKKNWKFQIVLGNFTFLLKISNFYWKFQIFVEIFKFSSKISKYSKFFEHLSISLFSKFLDNLKFLLKNLKYCICKIFFFFKISIKPSKF